MAEDQKEGSFSHHLETSKQLFFNFGKAADGQIDANIINSLNVQQTTHDECNVYKYKDETNHCNIAPSFHSTATPQL